MSKAAFAKDLPPALTRADNLPSVPAVALQVLRLTEDEDSTIDDLADAIACDPALAAKLLRLSNSSLFGVGQEVTTIQRATMVLGLKTVKLMSLSFSLANAIEPKRGVIEGFDFQEYWHRSLVNAATARALAERLETGLGDEAFLCGLLGHLGRLVLVKNLPAEYAPAIAKCNGWPTLEVEDKLLGFNHADVAAAVLASWELPELVYKTIGYRSRIEDLPADTPPRVYELGAVLHAAVLAEEVLCGGGSRPALDALCQCLARFTLNEQDVDELLVGLEANVNEMARTLKIELPDGLSHQELIERARHQIVHVSIGISQELNQTTRLNEDLLSRNRDLRSAANTDKLTGLANRKQFDDRLAELIGERMQGRLPRALGLILIDLDLFKRVNDTYGHVVGDAVLTMVGDVLAHETRKGDLPARYGGEEFAILIPSTTPFALGTTANRIREAIAQRAVPLEGGEEVRVTASAGAACLAQFRRLDEGRELIKLADHLLYRAKQNGRNRCETYKGVKLPSRASKGSARRAQPGDSIDGER